MLKQYVDFDGPDDPSNPVNWPLRKRIYLAVLLGLTTMVVAMASSIFTSIIPEIMVVYTISREVAILGVSLYVFGFASGPLCWAPFSELKGRYYPLVISIFGFTVFSFATAVSKDLQSLLILRFFTGFFGAGPLTLAGAVYGDIFAGRARGISMVAFCLMVFTGPLTAPFIGGFIVVNSHLGWRWTAYIPAILGAVCFILSLLTLKESYRPVLLALKADNLRREKDDWSIRAQHDELKLGVRTIATEFVVRPLKMLLFDPIVLCMSVFGSFVYGLLYLFLTAYPIIFQQIYGMTLGVGGLPFIGIILGQLFGAIGFFSIQPWIARKARMNGGEVMPEWSLVIAIPGATSFSAGLFWLGWSGYEGQTPWIVPAASGILTGFGLLTMFLPSIAYLVETRPDKSASAVASHTFLRSTAGGVFPLFAFYMFDALGVQWACTLLGCLAAILIPVPMLFYLFGARVRLRSASTETSPA